MSFSERGFTILEVLFSLALLTVCASGIISIVSYQSTALVRTRHQQELESQVDSLVASFMTNQSCARQMRQVLPKWPYDFSGTSLQFPFQKLEIDGKISPAVNAKFPKFPKGVLSKVTVDLSGIPLGDQKVVTGNLTVSYGVAGSPMIRTRNARLYFGIDGANRIDRCLDLATYRSLEWVEAGCVRMGGVLNKNGICDLTTSDTVKGHTCVGIGMLYVGGRCEFK